MAWLWWVGGAVLLAIAEVVSLDLVLAMLAGGALAGALAAALGVPIAGQVVVAALSSVVLLVALRPFLLRQLRTRVDLPETGVAALVGQPAVVVSAVGPEGGRVKIDGEVWTARVEGDVRLEPGAVVLVRRIDGATAVVAAAAPGVTA